jgi:hypothetical protein
MEPSPAVYPLVGLLHSYIELSRILPIYVCIGSMYLAYELCVWDIKDCGDTELCVWIKSINWMTICRHTPVRNSTYLCTHTSKQTTGTLISPLLLLSVFIYLFTFSIAASNVPCQLNMLVQHVASFR